ncbi:hypothetical protein [Streptomyces sp. NPDC059788]|uniref:hypothetical protein n=1 Tax=Streptomyces sp. NPDC059788 TaxID=3346948 RepID=UPI003665630C
MNQRKTSIGPRETAPAPHGTVPTTRRSASGPPVPPAHAAEGIRALLLVAVLPALLLTAVALSPPAATQLIGAGLLGAGCTAVGFAVAGWRCVSRRTDGRHW